VALARLATQPSRLIADRFIRHRRRRLQTNSAAYSHRPIGWLSVILHPPSQPHVAAAARPARPDDTRLAGRTERHRINQSINFCLLKMSRDTHKRLFNCEQNNKAETSTNSCPTNKLYTMKEKEKLNAYRIAYGRCGRIHDRIFLCCRCNHDQPDIAGYLSQVAPILTHPTRIWRPRRGWPRSNFAEIFGVRKPESLGYRSVLFLWSSVQRF